MVVAHTCDPRVLWAEAGECFEFEPSLCYWSARTWGAESYLFVLNRLDPRVAREEMQREGSKEGFSCSTPGERAGLHLPQHL